MAGKWWLTVWLAAAPAAGAAVYSCEIGGVTVYTSRPAANCQTASLPVIGSYRNAPAPAAKRPRSRTLNAVPPAAVPPETVPAKLADSRRSILQQELANEQQAVKTAEQALAEAVGRGEEAQMQLWRERLQDRRMNVKALERELGRM